MHLRNRRSVIEFRPDVPAVPITRLQIKMNDPVRINAPVPRYVLHQLPRPPNHSPSWDYHAKSFAGCSIAFRSSVFHPVVSEKAWSCTLNTYCRQLRCYNRWYLRRNSGSSAFHVRCTQRCNHATDVTGTAPVDAQNMKMKYSSPQFRMIRAAPVE